MRISIYLTGILKITPVLFSVMVLVLVSNSSTVRADIINAYFTTGGSNLPPKYDKIEAGYKGLCEDHKDNYANVFQENLTTVNSKYFADLAEPDKKHVDEFVNQVVRKYKDSDSKPTETHDGTEVTTVNGESKVSSPSSLAETAKQFCTKLEAPKRETNDEMVNKVVRTNSSETLGDDSDSSDTADAESASDSDKEDDPEQANNKKKEQEELQKQLDEEKKKLAEQKKKLEEDKLRRAALARGLGGREKEEEKGENEGGGEGGGSGGGEGGGSGGGSEGSVDDGESLSDSTDLHGEGNDGNAFSDLGETLENALSNSSRDRGRDRGNRNSDSEEDEDEDFGGTGNSFTNFLESLREDSENSANNFDLSQSSDSEPESVEPQTEPTQDLGNQNQAPTATSVPNVVEAPASGVDAAALLAQQGNDNSNSGNSGAAPVSGGTGAGSSSGTSSVGDIAPGSYGGGGYGGGAGGSFSYVRGSGGQFYGTGLGGSSSGKVGGVKKVANTNDKKKASTENIVLGLLKRSTTPDEQARGIFGIQEEAIAGTLGATEEEKALQGVRQGKTFVFSPDVETEEEKSIKIFRGRYNFYCMRGLCKGRNRATGSVPSNRFEPVRPQGVNLKDLNS